MDTVGWMVVSNTFFFFLKLGGLSSREGYIKAASLNFLLQFTVSYILALSHTSLVHLGHSATLLFGFFSVNSFSQLQCFIVSSFLVFSACASGSSEIKPKLGCRVSVAQKTWDKTCGVLTFH